MAHGVYENYGLSAKTVWRPIFAHKFVRNPIFRFEIIVNLIFHRFGLKMHIYSPEIGFGDLTP